MPSTAALSVARAAKVLLASTALAVTLCGCATRGTVIDSIATAALPGRAPPAGTDPQALAQYWGNRYDQSEKNREVVLNYAAALRQTGNIDQAVAVLQKAIINFPDDREVLAAYGKAQASAGQLVLALDAVHRAQTPDRPDWKLMSTEASILDQMGDTSEARQLHARAAAGAPNDPVVISNYGMSYVLTGDLKQAEALLKKAVALPDADGRVRQNLALVVGLQGRFEEAQNIASADLPADEAAANVAYLKKMLAQQNTWQQLQKSTKPANPPAATTARTG